MSYLIILLMPLIPLHKYFKIETDIAKEEKIKKTQ